MVRSEAVSVRGRSTAGSPLRLLSGGRGDLEQVIAIEPHQQAELGAGLGGSEQILGAALTGMQHDVLHAGSAHRCGRARIRKSLDLIRERDERRWKFARVAVDGRMPMRGREVAVVRL